MSAWTDLVARLGIKLPFPTEVRVEALPDLVSDERLVVTLHVPCVDTGKPITVHTMTHLPELRRIGESAAVDLVRRALLRSVSHEVDEAIFIDGKHAFEPHANDPKVLP